jgi:hypothetical protein
MELHDHAKDSEIVAVIVAAILRLSMKRFLKRLAEISLAGNIIMNLSCVYLKSSRTFQLAVVSQFEI